MEEIFSNSPEETIELGKKIATTLKKGDVIVLTRRFRFWKDKVNRGNSYIFWIREGNI